MGVCWWEIVLGFIGHGLMKSSQRHYGDYMDLVLYVPML
jgi:tRNA isopentenyl-2-thiomethyl-A-37 hydroxylase MiaE